MLRNLRRNIRKNRGFTLVELMIVVAIVGILAALAIYGVSKYMKSAKTAEARNSLGQLSKDAAAAYNRERMGSEIIDPGKATAVSHALCGSASKVPSVDANVQGKKYQSQASEWSAGSADAGWQCLKFSMNEPQYYQYNYTLTGSATENGAEYTASAKGDLDGNNTWSTFTLKGEVRDKTVVTSPSIGEENPEE